MGVNNLVIIGVAGSIFSLSVIVEVLEKLFGSDSPTWSVLKLMGPQPWIPINGDPVRVVSALAIMVFSMLYFVACCILDKAAMSKNFYLVVPWILCEGSTNIYQICAALNVRDRFTKVEESLLFLDTLLGFAAMGYVILISCTWLQRPSRHSNGVDREDAEATVLHTYVAPEGAPLLQTSEQTQMCVSKMPTKPWKPVDVSLLGKLAAMENAAGKRVHFQTPECSPTTARTLEQKTPKEWKTGQLLPDIGYRESAVPSWVDDDDRLVKYVKPSNSIPETVFRYGGQLFNASTRCIAFDRNEINGQCIVEDCDYWPCNELTLHSNCEMGIRCDLQLESSTRSLSTERMHCNNGSCFRGQELGAKENIYDVPEYVEEPARNGDYPSNIHATITEIRDAEFTNEVTFLQIQKFTPNPCRTLPGVCQSIMGYTGSDQERDSFITMDSSTLSKNENNSSSDLAHNFVASTCTGGVTCQEVETDSGISSPITKEPPGASREGNIWIWPAADSTKHLLLSGGKGLGFRYSVSDMDQVVLGPRACGYLGSRVQNASGSTGDSGGKVWQRVLAPGTDLMRSSSWEGSFANLQGNKLVFSCPSLSSQSGSSLSQTTSEFLEECMKHKPRLTAYSSTIPTATTMSRLYEASNKTESNCSCSKRECDSLEQVREKAGTSDPGMENSEEDLVEHVRRLAKSLAQHNLKRSDHWF